MSVEAVREELQKFGVLDKYREFSVSSATVAEAARAIGCEPGRIAKTLAFITREGPILVVAMGLARIDNRLFKNVFGQKAIFPKAGDLPEMVGHPAGGVCPFAVKKNTRIFLDESLKQYDPVWPAAGATNNAVQLSLSELESITGGQWVRITKDMPPDMSAEDVAVKGR